MRKFEELLIKIALWAKHVKVVCVGGFILGSISFMTLTALGFAPTPYQPYHLFCPNDFADFETSLKSFNFEQTFLDIHLMMTYSPGRDGIAELPSRIYSVVAAIYDTSKIPADRLFEDNNRIKADYRVRAAFWTKYKEIIIGSWRNIEHAIARKAIFDLGCSMIVTLIYLVILIVVFAEDGDTAEPIRGASIVNPEDLKSQLKGKDARISTGKEGLPLARHDENLGIFEFGAPGSGKSTFVKHLIPQIAGDGAIIYDRKPEFFPLFFVDGKDRLFDPLDARTVLWDVFREIRCAGDIDNIVRSLIPVPTDPKDQFWNLAAQDVFRAIFNRLWRDGGASNKKLITFLYENGSSRERLYRALKNDPRVEGHLAIDNNTSAGIMSVVSQFANTLMKEHFSYEGDFSIRDFVRQGKGRLFVVNRAKTEESFKTYFTLLFDLAFQEFLSRDIDRNFRYWFIIDEFPSLMRLETLQKLLAEGRDRGCCAVLGAQDFMQVKRIYGPDAYSLFNQTNTKIIFRVNDPESAEYLSRAFGDREIIVPTENLSVSGSKAGGYSFGKQQRVNRLVLPSEITKLPPLTAYVSCGAHPITMISFSIPDQLDKTSLQPRDVPEIGEDHDNRQDNTSGEQDDLLY